MVYLAFRSMLNIKYLSLNLEQKQLDSRHIQPITKAPTLAKLY